MSSYNTNKIIEKIMEKTDSKKIIWKTYNIENDKNPYSRKYFSTFPIIFLAAYFLFRILIISFIFSYRRKTTSFLFLL